MGMELLTKEIFHESIRTADSICILGHVSPDGDCLGSTLGAYNYIKNVRAGEEFEIQVYLEEINAKFTFLKGSEKISSDNGDGKVYDLAVICDCADELRIGKYARYYQNAKQSIMIDHHFTNPGFGDYCVIKGDASSASEVLFDLMDETYFDKSVAECIYTGIAHDTGVFRYSSTSEHTMNIAGKCISKGIEFGKIIEESFFAMTFAQKIVVGHVLSNIKSRAEGQIVYGYLSMDTRKMLSAEDMDMDGIIDQIRTTQGALAAAFMYETKDKRVKASLRSNTDLIDVSRVCQANGGGGHKKAAGCFMSLDFEKNMDEIEADFKEQINNAL